jgi:hypothetical protein
MHKECSICGAPIKGHGNNSLPLAEGKCCDICNILVIELRRIPKDKLFMHEHSKGIAVNRLTKCDIINLILKIRPNYPSSFLWRAKKSALLKFYKKLREDN